MFKRCVEETLGLPVDASKIRPIYDYVHEKFGAHYIFYIEVTEVIPKKLANKEQTKWISLSKLSKHNMSEQTRHDIIVGERVIRASMEQAAQPSAPAKGWH